MKLRFNAFRSQIGSNAVLAGGHFHPLHWGPKGWGVDDPDSSTAERLSRRSRLPGARIRTTLSRPLAAGLLQVTAWKKHPGRGPKKGGRPALDSAAALDKPVEQIEGAGLEERRSGTLCLNALLGERRVDASRVFRPHRKPLIIPRRGRPLWPILYHRACAMRCTVLTLTPCVAAITRTPGRSFRRSAAWIAASTSAAILGRPSCLPSSLARRRPARTRSWMMELR
jgi:hypothetical protein